MKTAKLNIKRTEKGTGRVYWQSYEVELEDKLTVLQALQDIYEKQDSSLAFLAQCRYKWCGLCGMMVNGKPQLACTVWMRGDVELAPLENQPVIRDLAIDRRPLFDALRRNQIHLLKTGQAKHAENATALLQVSECVECQCCTAMCPKINGDGKFLGPYTFVKLAQLHYYTGDTHDRIEQARELGIERCRGCGKCTCHYGVPLQRDVIGMFLKG